MAVAAIQPQRGNIAESSLVAAKLKMALNAIISHAMIVAIIMNNGEFIFAYIARRLRHSQPLGSLVFTTTVW